ncbi:testis-expressed protein 10 homolog [Phymastichus coffea]|uniref:testis-expressed protein 10 homolog n=1 Tax=Phymastichus coffea TaxID=108790 RepID=UPI00273CE7DC|nr:testis-expressed protein 10 homolog [Phymastichus coffea]
MGKNHRHQKQLKSEKAKVKLKTKGSQSLPKGLNITDASFKTKKIIIREQLKQQDETQILSRRKLNIKDLLTRLQHYNSSIRQDAIRELKEIISRNSVDVLNIQLNILFKGITILVLDKEKAIRRESLKALSFILASISKDQLLPFCDILISYLTCAMTHIDQNIMEDSLLFLDILLQYCSVPLANNSHKILLYFLDMISKLRSQAQPGRQLTTNLNTKSTCMKWRIKVLNSLEKFLSAIVYHQKYLSINSSVCPSKIYYIKDEDVCCPIYSPISLQICSMDFKRDEFQNSNDKSLNTYTLQRYIDSLMPLMFDSWLEASPKSSNSTNVQLFISAEAAYLLKCITSIIQSIIEYIKLLENENGTSVLSIWFRDNFQSAFIKIFLHEFPYIQQKYNSRTKRSGDEFASQSLVHCLEQNLTLCYIYIWFTTISNNTVIRSNKKNAKIDFCNEIMQFLTDKLENWSNNEAFAVGSMVKVLNILFLQASAIWYRNKIYLGKVLKSSIDTYLNKTKKDLQKHLFAILKNIVMDHTLRHLHEEEVFKEFIKTLPALLLKDTIHESTICMLNKVVLQYRQWLQKELEENYDAIIENAKKIQILESGNESDSRLMICNLFYFMHGQVYY